MWSGWAFHWSFADIDICWPSIYFQYIISLSFFLLIPSQTASIEDISSVTKIIQQATSQASKLLQTPNQDYKKLEVSDRHVLEYFNLPIWYNDEGSKCHSGFVYYCLLCVLFNLGI